MIGGDTSRELILSYARSSRNGDLHTPYTHGGHRHNRQCGDEVEIRLTLDGETIGMCSYRARGCALSTASASLLEELVVGMTVEEALSVTRRFERHLSGQEEETMKPGDGVIPPELEIFTALRDNPQRRNCVLLPWWTLTDALQETR